jgi:hypothetical protein
MRPDSYPYRGFPIKLESLHRIIFVYEKNEVRNFSHQRDWLPWRAHVIHFHPLDKADMTRISMA